MKSFDLEEARICQEIAKLGAKNVLLQLPEGLKPEAPRLAKIIEKLGATPIVSADPCYGACDLPSSEAESLGVDLIIHYGHAKLMKQERATRVYFEARATIDVDAVVEKALTLMGKWNRIGLTTTVQHVQTLDIAREMLLHAGKIVEIGDAGRLEYPGQVIGCDYSNAKSIVKDVEAFLFIGGGQFHALGIALSTMKPTVAADPYDGRAFSVDEEAARIVKQRWANIATAQKAKTFGVLIGLKIGQKRLEQSLQIRQKLRSADKTAFLLAITEITPEALMEFPTIDAYVNTACPRISIDDSSRFRKPVLTVNETRVVVGEWSWDELCRKGLFGNFA